MCRVPIHIQSLNLYVFYLSSTTFSNHKISFILKVNLINFLYFLISICPLYPAEGSSLCLHRARILPLEVLTIPGNKHIRWWALNSLAAAPSQRTNMMLNDRRVAAVYPKNPFSEIYPLNETESVIFGRENQLSQGSSWWSSAYILLPSLREQRPVPDELWMNLTSALTGMQGPIKHSIFYSSFGFHGMSSPSPRLPHAFVYKRRQGGLSQD